MIKVIKMFVVSIFIWTLFLPFNISSKIIHTVSTFLKIIGETIDFFTNRVIKELNNNYQHGKKKKIFKKEN